MLIAIFIHDVSPRTHSSRRGQPLFLERLLFGYEHICFRQPAFLGHLVAVVEVGGVLVAGICAEGELQAGTFGPQNESLVGDVRYLVDFDCQLLLPSPCR